MLRVTGMLPNGSIMAKRKINDDRTCQISNAPKNSFIFVENLKITINNVKSNVNIKVEYEEITDEAKISQITNIRSIYMNISLNCY